MVYLGRMSILPQELRDLVDPSPEKMQQLFSQGPSNCFDELVLILTLSRFQLITEDQTKECLQELAHRIVQVYHKKYPGPIVRYVLI